MLAFAKLSKLFIAGGSVAIDGLIGFGFVYSCIGGWQSNCEFLEGGDGHTVSTTTTYHLFVTDLSELVKEALDMPSFYALCSNLECFAKPYYRFVVNNYLEVLNFSILRPGLLGFKW